MQGEVLVKKLLVVGTIIGILVPCAAPAREFGRIVPVASSGMGARLDRTGESQWSFADQDKVYVYRIPDSSEIADAILFVEFCLAQPL